MTEPTPELAAPTDPATVPPIYSSAETDADAPDAPRAGRRRPWMTTAAVGAAGLVAGGVLGASFTAMAAGPSTDSTSQQGGPGSGQFGQRGQMGQPPGSSEGSGTGAGQPPTQSGTGTRSGSQSSDSGSAT